jgi:hypothetical protein
VLQVVLEKRRVALFVATISFRCPKNSVIELCLLAPIVANLHSSIRRYVHNTELGSSVLL